MYLSLPARKRVKIGVTLQQTDYHPYANFALAFFIASCLRHSRGKADIIAEQLNLQSTVDKRSFPPSMPKYRAVDQRGERAGRFDHDRDRMV